MNEEWYEIVSNWIGIIGGDSIDFRIVLVFQEQTLTRGKLGFMTWAFLFRENNYSYYE